MKKGILLIASAAALVLGSNNAFAAAPNWYNFQGVCLEQNATVTVQFDIVNANNTLVYSETHLGVQTNASGIFSLHVGQGTVLEGNMPDSNQLNAGGLTLITSVNGVEISHAPLGAVPYAVHAEGIGEYTAQDISNLAEEFQTLWENVGSYDDQIADLWDAVQPLAGIMPEYTKMVQDVALNTEGIANAEQAIAELSPAVKGNTAAIAKLQEDVELNITGIGEAENAILELSPAVKGNTAAIAKLQELQDQLQEYVMEQIGDEGTVVKTITWLSNAINDIEENYVTTEQLDKDMAGFQENIEMALKAYATTEDLEASKKDLDDALGSIDRNAGAIIRLQSLVNENYEAYQEDFQKMAEVSADMSDAINNLTTDLVAVQDQLVPLAGVEKTINMLINKVATLEEKVAELEAK